MSSRGNAGKKISKAGIAQSFEHNGNIVTVSSTLPGKRTSLDGKYALVYWPEDDCTRLCHILGWQDASQMYKVTYLFDGKVYDENFDTEWKLVELTKQLDLDFNSDAGTQSNPNSNR